jgi:hypothetical protein
LDKQAGWKIFQPETGAVFTPWRTLSPSPQMESRESDSGSTTAIACMIPEDMTIDNGRRTHIEVAGVVHMAISAREAFPLFNAKGERRWAAGWDPRYLHPLESGVGEGAVFQTSKTAGTATWVQTRHDPAAGLASFVYVLPDHHAALVDVSITPDGDCRSRASVTYRMTSLSSDADAFVKVFGDAFKGFMTHWEEAIQRHIVEGVPLVEV